MMGISFSGGFSFSGLRRREYALEEMETDHAGDVSVLHREDFLRPWSQEEFASLIGDSHVFGFVVRQVGNRTGRPVGFVLARLAAGEAEILSVAVAKNHRRGGLGWKLMDAVLRRLHADRAEALFLEVDERNVAAIALYRRLGFHQVGKRPAYYETMDGTGRSSALVLRRDLR